MGDRSILDIDLQKKIRNTLDRREVNSNDVINVFPSMNYLPQNQDNYGYRDSEISFTNLKYEERLSPQLGKPRRLSLNINKKKSEIRRKFSDTCRKGTCGGLQQLILDEDNYKKYAKDVQNLPCITFKDYYNENLKYLDVSPSTNSCGESAGSTSQYSDISLSQIDPSTSGVTSPSPPPEIFPNNYQRPLTPYSNCGSSISLFSRTSISSDSSGNLSLSEDEDPIYDAKEPLNYFPNCDPRVWLRSCTRPVNTPINGRRRGTIPKWLKGSLIRNGPGRIQVGNDTYKHIFDGSALLHRFYFNDGEVIYSNKFLESTSYLKDTKAQRIVVNYFGTKAHPDPCKTILQNIASRFSFEEHFTDNAQISAYPYGDALYALTETPYIFKIDPDTLDTKEKVDLTKHIAIFNHTAHPHVQKNGCVYNLGQGVGLTGPVYHICEFPADSPFEKAKIVGTVKARWPLSPCYMHSYAITPNYYIIIEQPLVVSTVKVIKGILCHETLIEALKWWDIETKFHVVDKKTGKVNNISYETEPFFFLHTVNAYEDNGHIVIDICAYRDAKMLDCMYTEALKNASYDPSYAKMFRGRPKRWVLPLNPKTDVSSHENLCTLFDTECRAKWVNKGKIFLIPELLTDIGCEVPRINYEQYNGKKYKYFYAICSDVDHPIPGTLVKVDVENKCHKEWSEYNVYPSEPIFIPSPISKNEDDGVILSALLRCQGLENQVCLLVLDAVSFQEIGRVEFETLGPIPKCLHGWFVPDGCLKIQKKDDANKNILT